MLPIEETTLRIRYRGQEWTGRMPCRRPPAFPIASATLATLLAFWQAQFSAPLARRFVAAECRLRPRTVARCLANPAARATRPVAHPTAQPLVVCRCS